jgi:5-methyltetrahydrofolate--homocysteine methyltransferase
VTVGPRATELVQSLEREGEFAEQLFVHGLAVQAAEGTAEWLHSEVRRDLGIAPDQGRRYSWGYPACPDQEEHVKVERLLGFSRVGIRLSGGYALEPEQSTVAIVAHHPQAVYFGMKSGFIPKERSRDEVIALSEKSGGTPPDEEPEEGLVEEEARAGVRAAPA